ncbi:hypothetical protein [Streptomyces sp. NPDC048309]
MTGVEYETNPELITVIDLGPMISRLITCWISCQIGRPINR